MTRVVAAVAVTCTAAFSCTPTCSCSGGGHDEDDGATIATAPPRTMPLPPVRMSTDSPTPPPADELDEDGAPEAEPDTESTTTRRALVQLTDEEVAEVVPAIDDTRVLVEPAVDPTSARVETKLCLDGRSMFDAVAALNDSLVRDGWTNIHERAHPSRHDRVSVAAQRPPYRLSATVQLGNWPECARHDGHAYASLVIHKVRAPPTSATNTTQESR